MSRFTHTGDTGDTGDAEGTEGRAAAFRALHEPGRLLILPCVWDVASARLVGQLPGVAALATTSAGVAAAHGVVDGQVIGADAALTAVADIVAATELPVSADLEWGYGGGPDGVGEVVARALAAGVVGINLEDVTTDGTGLATAEEHVARIIAARRAANRAGVDLFVSARTDVWWRGLPADPATRFAEGVRRLAAYRAAGADCLFAPGFPTAEDEVAADGTAAGAIGRLASALDGAPLHLLAVPGLPDPSVLAGLGVSRVSTGSALYRAALAGAAESCRELLDGPGWAPEWAGLARSRALPYGRLVELLTDH